MMDDSWRIKIGPAIWMSAGYAMLLLAIAYWPAPVQAVFSDGVSRLIVGIDDLTGIPALVVFDVIEIGANVLLFVPVGIIAGLAFGSGRTWLAVPVAIAVSVCLELGQSWFLDERTGSALDVVANTLGAAAGAAVPSDRGASAPSPDRPRRRGAIRVIVPVTRSTNAAISSREGRFARPSRLRVPS